MCVYGFTIWVDITTHLFERLKEKTQATASSNETQGAWTLRYDWLQNAPATLWQQFSSSLESQKYT